MKDRPEECSSVIDNVFDGVGLRIYAWLQKYLEYLGRFYHKATISKTEGHLLRLAFWESRRSRFDNGGSNTYLGGRGVRADEFYVNSG